MNVTRGLGHSKTFKVRRYDQNSELKKSMIQNGACWIIFKISRNSQSRDERKAIPSERTGRANTKSRHVGKSSNAL